MHHSSKQGLQESHEPQTIRERLAQERQHSYVGDGILGAVDGCVTTFAIVAGAMGGTLSAGVVLILGFSNVLADGFSMAVSNYQKAKSEANLIQRVRRVEESHIQHIPEGEKEEVREIYRRKGFEAPLLDQIVDHITADQKLWIDTMLTEEYGLPLETPSASRAGVVTFLAFALVGSLSLIPFLFSSFLNSEALFPLSTGITAITFFSIGFAKGKYVGEASWKSGLETFIIGGLAAALAYGVGIALRGLI